ncbi:MAG: inorganic diphosphatase [Saprospiraceae bacterium]
MAFNQSRLYNMHSNLTKVTDPIFPEGLSLCTRFVQVFLRLVHKAKPKMRSLIFFPSLSRNLIGVIAVCIGLVGCQSAADSPVDISQLPAFQGDSLLAVIEIPAGTNLKIEYQHTTRTFEPDQLDGKDRVVSFLPYPGNYGFIPGTLMDTAQGGDGDPLDVLVISASLPTGTVLPIRLLGALVLKDRGELDTKLIAIPLAKEQQVIAPGDFMEFSLEYDAARRIIEDWFQYYKGDRAVEIVRWEDQDYARDEVVKWQVSAN